MKLLFSILFCIVALLVSNGHLESFSTKIRALTNIIWDYSNNITIMSPNTATTAPAASQNFRGLPVIPPNDPSLTKSPDMAVPRAIRSITKAIEQSEGVGARVRRSIGTPKLRNLSPFLMLDHFKISPGAGFPDHPHRGQETITYALSGGIDHEDFTGNKGSLGPGDLQFMTAGKGIVHAEMPRPDAEGNNEGMQLWVDLPKHLKYCDPRYRDLRDKEIPRVQLDGGKVNIKVISGQSHGVDSVQELAYTPVWFLDVAMKPGAKLQQPLPANWTAFAYTIDGTVRVGKDKKTVEKFNNVVFEQKGDSILAEVADDATEDARFIIIAGMPLDQPIVQYGPFVLNSQEEVYQSFMDYQMRENGFERAGNWESEIGKKMMH